MLGAWHGVFFGLLPLIVQAALPPCTWDSCPVCLEDAKRPANLSLVARDGKTYVTPLRVAGPSNYWDSLGVLGRAFGIMVQERLGLNVAYTNCMDGTQCLLAEMGCTDWANYAACSPTTTKAEAVAAVESGIKVYPDPLPDVFLVMEQWPAVVERTPGAAVPETVEEYGMTGYPTDYNILVSESLVEEAWQNRSMDLLGFRAYMRPGIASVFSSPARVAADEKFSPTFGTVCPGMAGSQYPGSALRFARKAMIPYGWVCRDGWWLAPACAALGDSWVTECVPLIQPDIWYTSSVPIYYGIAVAGMRIASVPVVEHLALVTKYKTLYLWWSTMDLRYRALNPQAVTLFQWENTTSRILTTKSVWAPVLDASARLAIFVRQFVWSTAMIVGLMADMETAYLQGQGPNDEVQPGFYQKIACEWLRKNEASWVPLLPSPSSCSTGEVFNYNTSACSPCPPGTQWVPAHIGDAACVLCPAGETQPDAGRTSCLPCSRGSYNHKNGSRVAPDSCTPCEPGRYSASSGSSTCEACPEGQSTLAKGSSSLDECICDVGHHSSKAFPSLADSNEQCIPCEESMSCSPGQDIPNLKPGFYSSPDDPLHIFKCGATANADDEDGSARRTLCLGGVVGNVTCKDGRSGFLCQDCPEGLIPTQKQCLRCRSGDFAGIVICAILLALAIAFLLVASTRSAVTDDHRSTAAASLFAQAVTFIQVLAAIHSLGVSWGTPFADLLQWLSIYTLDLDVIRIGCASFNHPVGKYALKMTGPAFAVLILILAALLTNVVVRRVVLTFDSIFNAVGQVLTVVFISISLASLVPFQCFTHPHGERSLVTAPSVMCWQSKAHQGMVALSVIALFMYVLSTLVLVLFATLRYPQEILKEEVHFVRRFRFLFFRFQPEHYWFPGVLMARNFLLALFPMVIPPEIQGLSLILMQLTILSCCMISVHFFPWRSLELNWSDLAMNLTLQGVLMVATLAYTSGPMSVIASSILCACCGGGLIYCALAMLWKVLQRLLRTSDWALFLSHHKLGGACTARFLKTVLQTRLRGKVFLDSDDLSSLWLLLDAVRSSKAMLVLLSSEVLNRPWCVGEIITAHQCGIPILLCTAECGRIASIPGIESLVKKSHEDLAARQGSLDALRPHGIALEQVQEAFQALLSKPLVHLNFSQSQALAAGVAELGDKVRALGAARRHSLILAKKVYLGVPTVACVGCGAPWMHSKPREQQLEAGDPSAMDWASDRAALGGFWLVLSDPLDIEAVAAARAIKVMIQPRVQRMVFVDTVISKHELVEVFQSPRLESVMWLVTQGTLSSAPQLARLATFYKLLPDASVHPVIVGGRNVKLPGQAFYADLEAGLGAFAPDGGCLGQEATIPLTLLDVSAAVQQVFMSIATCVDIPNASEQMLATSLGSLIRNAQLKPKSLDLHRTASEPLSARAHTLHAATGPTTGTAPADVRAGDFTSVTPTEVAHEITNGALRYV